MRLFLFLLLSLVLHAELSFAQIPFKRWFSFGPDVKRLKEKDHPAFCKVNISYPNGRMSLCSGTLVSTTHILTAAHCFDAAVPTTQMIVTAQCGETYSSQATGVFIQGDGGPHPRGLPSQDLAVLQLETAPEKDYSIPIARYPALYFEGGRLKDSVDCLIAGYGISDQGPAGQLRGFRPNRKKVLIQDTTYPGIPGSFLEMRAREGEKLENSVDFGDSGGTFVCRLNSNASFELVAVNSSKTFWMNEQLAGNRFTPVFTDSSNAFLQAALNPLR